LKPLIIAVNQDPVLHAHLVVRKDCKAASYADLKGQTVAMPRSGREHCRLFLEKRCTAAGVPANHFYAHVNGTRDCDDALNEVFDGDAQGAIVDGNELAAYLKRKPNRAVQLRTLLESEPFPCAWWPIARSHFRRPGGKVPDGMVAANQNEQGRQVLNLCKITSFDAVPDAYEQCWWTC